MQDETIIEHSGIRLTRRTWKEIGSMTNGGALKSPEHYAEGIATFWAWLGPRLLLAVEKRSSIVDLRKAITIKAIEPVAQFIHAARQVRSGRALYAYCPHTKRYEKVVHGALQHFSK